MFRQEQREQEDREKKRAEKDKPFGLLARMKASGLEPGQQLPAVDGIESDHTIESFAMPLGKPVEWAAKLIRASWLWRGIGKVATKGETIVYRVFGGDARAQGFSWTTVNPTSISDFRNLAGLPSGGASGAINTAEFMIKGKTSINSIIKSRPALPLDGNIGGLPELIIDPKNIKIIDFKVLKP
ncbi:hypothetical protein DYBT9623_01605 [Dyadobacter sp. CECT 9623]|uniref:Uncharacterized protein n=1 Tax=Dyadobacter linearis TaxID=2823330 RepID=A0ABM8UN13_9BACT|nr:hypothetical protein [Dyadobacter sp. CECT 9623]CAG5068873.1 hypothetical protein DYBT9623_01605 [Dyadobacter sp. CECT 9623]